MKSEILLHDQKNIDYAQEKMLETLEKKELYEVIIRPLEKRKTLAQLAGLLGIWYNYIIDQTGYTWSDLHTKHKIEFLSDIYLSGHKNNIQKYWCNEFYKYQSIYNDNPNNVNHLKKLNHLNEISLSWATTKQMNEYMNRIEQHYISVGQPLPILDKFNRYYK